MNLDLYNSEFRDFKYLKSSAADVAYFKRRAVEVNRIQPWADENNPEFVWPCRLEFVEQLFDLRNDIVYIVQPGNLYPIEHRQNSYDYEDTRLYAIEKPIIVYGPLIDSNNLEDILTEDGDLRVSSMSRDNLCVCSGIENSTKQIVIKITDIGLLPSPPSYVGVFYDKEWAEKYKIAITEFLRKNNDAVSAITRLF